MHLLCCETYSTILMLNLGFAVSITLYDAFHGVFACCVTWLHCHVLHVNHAYTMMWCLFLCRLAFFFFFCCRRMLCLISQTESWLIVEFEHWARDSDDDGNDGDGLSKMMTRYTFCLLPLTCLCFGVIGVRNGLKAARARYDVAFYFDSFSCFPK